MSIETFFLIGTIVFCASCLQSATGLGYGVIAGPLFLFIFDSDEALQLSALHNLAIAVILTTLIYKDVDRKFLKNLIIGGLLGTLIGFIIQILVDINFLKIFATFVIFFVAVSLFQNTSKNKHKNLKKFPTFLEIRIVGIIAGIMGGILAIPGPIAAAWMSFKGFSKKEIRASVIIFFVFVYGTIVGLYIVVTGIPANILYLSLELSPFLAIGLIIGTFLSKIISEKLFQYILLSILILIFFSLLSNLLKHNLKYLIQ